MCIVWQLKQEGRALFNQGWEGARGVAAHMEEWDSTKSPLITTCVICEEWSAAQL